jgi:hypothetical protein
MIKSQQLVVLSDKISTSANPQHDSSADTRVAPSPRCRRRPAEAMHRRRQEARSRAAPPLHGGAGEPLEARSPPSLLPGARRRRPQTVQLVAATGP